MKEQKLSNQESLDLITTMIQNSKKRMELGSGNILIAWGYVTTIIALIIGCGLLLTNNVLWMWLWFAIPAIGYPLHYFLAKKKENKTLEKALLSEGETCLAKEPVCYVFISLFIRTGNTRSLGHRTDCCSQEHRSRTSFP